MQREEMTLGVERELRVGEMVAALVVGQKTFRCASPPISPGGRSRRAAQATMRLLGIVLALVAEAAADIGRDHADRALAACRAARSPAADVVRHLRRAHSVSLSVPGSTVGEHRPRLDRRADQAIVDEIEP